MTELANIKKNAISTILSAGEHAAKDGVLRLIVPKRLAKLHKSAQIHIHDLEYYNTVYNCIGLQVTDLVKDSSLQVSQALRRLFREIVKLTNDQSGGIGFLSFDEDMTYFKQDESDEVLIEAFRNFFVDLNMPTRKGCEKPYTTLNIGLSTSAEGRRIAKAVLAAIDAGDENGNPFIFPNVVFKLSKNINVMEDGKNFDLFKQALKVTASKMVPTYFNCDAPFNKDADPNKIGIMGCRTRVVSDLYGNPTGLNRGNIASVTMNLVQLAMKSNGDYHKFITSIDETLDDCRDLLMHRYETLCNNGNEPAAISSGFYQDAHLGCKGAFLHGTLSIGFIGLWDALSEMFQIDFSNKESLEKYHCMALDIVQHMRDRVDSYIQRHRLNFSLLASAAEGTTGTFADHDLLEYGDSCKAAKKGFYTNSFHVPVNTSINFAEKIELEAPFHAICNGGCITYVEFEEPPHKNVEAVYDAVSHSFNQGCNYFGINFPLDVCNECGHTGRIASTCRCCGSSNIKRLRRVSGYLSEQSSFTRGKAKELLMRKSSL